MASPTTPTHGRDGAIWMCRLNGFSGSGLNDLTWGNASTNAATAYYEVVIDGTGSPNTFKWRKNGGSWTSGVSITGSAQTLDEGQTVTFGATTGHTATDSWSRGNLVSEPCTVSGAQAQITSTARRCLNPNAPPTFTDSGGKTVVDIDYAAGIATFSGNAGTVTCTGKNGFVPTTALQKGGYLTDWSINTTVTFDDITAMGDKWEDQTAGLASATGSANGFFIGTRAFFDMLNATAGGTQGYFLLKLFTYDPDQDQTGDHLVCWASFTGNGINAPLKAVVSESLNFKAAGRPYFVANT